LVAVAAAVLAVAARLGLDQLIGRDFHPYLTIYFSAALVAWLAGLRPALVTLVLGIFLCLWVVVPPRDSLALRGPEDLVEILVCLLITFVIISFIVAAQLNLKAKRQSETAREQLAEAHRQTTSLLESISDAFTSLNHDWRYTYVNGPAARLLGRPPEALLGRSFWEVWPKEIEPFLGPPLLKALAENVHVRFDVFCGEPFNAWFEVRGYPSAEGLGLFFTDITARKNMEKVLAEAKEGLARYNKELELVVQERTGKLRETIHELEGFSYALAHDMRAPLRAMHGYATMLEGQSQVASEPKAHDLCQRIARAAERLDHLIQDALQYAKTLRQEVPLALVDLSALIPGLLESYPALEAHRGRIAIEGSLPRVWGNQAGLTQCFASLLTNAVKFMVPGGMPRLRIWAEPRGSRTRVWVEDNGIGIAPADQARIFNMFVQVTGEHGGTGVGLAIAKKAVERMGGSIGVESESGRGSRFWVELRREPAPSPNESNAFQI
jgi:signal transduction histidine kinase